MSNILTVQDIKAVTVTAKRWFDRTYGNTYHSVTLSVLIPVSLANDLDLNKWKRPLDDGEVWVDLAYEPFLYGYGDAWGQTAMELFYIAVMGIEEKSGTLSYFCSKINLPFCPLVHDVKRKKICNFRVKLKDIKETVL
jgi:hypothetical protein